MSLFLPHRKKQRKAIQWQKWNVLIIRKSWKHTRGRRWSGRHSYICCNCRRQRMIVQRSGRQKKMKKQWKNNSMVWDHQLTRYEGINDYLLVNASPIKCGNHGLLPHWVFESLCVAQEIAKYAPSAVMVVDSFEGSDQSLSCPPSLTGLMTKCSSTMWAKVNRDADTERKDLKRSSAPKAKATSIIIRECSWRCIHSGAGVLGHVA